MFWPCPDADAPGHAAAVRRPVRPPRTGAPGSSGSSTASRRSARPGVPVRADHRPDDAAVPERHADPAGRGARWRRGGPDGTVCRTPSCTPTWPAGTASSTATWCELRTRRGVAVFRARLTTGIRTGHRVRPVPLGGRVPREHPHRPDALDPVSRMPAFKACAVAVAPRPRTQHATGRHHHGAHPCAVAAGPTEGTRLGQSPDLPAGRLRVRPARASTRRSSLDAALSYTVPDGAIAQTVYFRGGNTTDELVCVVLIRDGVPMRYFPIGAKGDVHVPLRVVEDLDAGHRRSSCTSAAPAGVAGRRRRRPRPGGGVTWPGGTRRRRARDLVVVGNGMAGARTVEEILERGGAEQFRHHDVRRGAVRQLQPDHAVQRAVRRSRSEDGHLPQPPGLVRGERHHAARRGPGRAASTGTRSTVRATDGSRTPYDMLDHRHRQPARSSPTSRACARAGRGFHQGVFRFRTLDDTRAHDPVRPRPRARRRHRRRPARPGGGARPADTTASTSPSCTPPGT